MIHESSSPARSASFRRLADLLRDRRAVVLTGAGCSTGSGIPDYRGPDGRLRNRMPMQYREFMRSPEARRRYWARSFVGWPRFSRARPNRAHRALARLEELGVVRGVITQNVDGLHRAAGSRRVVDLHGLLSRVRCTACGAEEDRHRVQDRLRRLNPGLGAPAGRVTPDGDAELPRGVERDVQVPGCRRCDGVIKPDVVFFGENVPAPRVEAAWDLYRGADVLLVAGSSLTVFSGRRFVLRARTDARPVAIVNRGVTRGDEAALVKVDGSVDQVLPAMVEAAERRRRMAGTPADRRRE